LESIVDPESQRTESEERDSSQRRRDLDRERSARTGSEEGGGDSDLVESTHQICDMDCRATWHIELHESHVQHTERFGHRFLPDFAIDSISVDFDLLGRDSGRRDRSSSRKSVEGVGGIAPIDR